MTVFAVEADTTNVAVFIGGGRIELSADIRSQIGQRSVDLLASCAYMNAKPNWGAAREAQTMADAQKQSHLHLVFSSPQKIEVPSEKITVRAREMVITLPLKTAGIWVRTDDGILYFAMFEHTVADRLQRLLHDAQKPGGGA